MATQLLRQPERALPAHPGYESQDLHPAQWRCSARAVDARPRHLFIAAEPAPSASYGTVSPSPASVSAVRCGCRACRLTTGPPRRSWPWRCLCSPDPVTGLDVDAYSLLGYRSPMHGPRPQVVAGFPAVPRSCAFLAERVRSWLRPGLEPHAIAGPARSAARSAAALYCWRPPSSASTPASLICRSHIPAVRPHDCTPMTGLEFQASTSSRGSRAWSRNLGGRPPPATEGPPSRYAHDLHVGNAASCFVRLHQAGITSTSPAKPASRGPFLPAVRHGRAGPAPALY